MINYDALDLGLGIFMFLHRMQLNLAPGLTLVSFNTLLRYLGGSVKGAIKGTLGDCFLTQPTTERSRQIEPVACLLQKDIDSQVAKLVHLENIFMTVSCFGLLCHLLHNAKVISLFLYS